MRKDKIPHRRFVELNFVPVENVSLYSSLPTQIDLDLSGNQYDISDWMELPDSKIYLPIIEKDGNSTYYSKCYCHYCNAWINSKYKIYYLDQHIARESHSKNVQIRDCQTKIHQAVGTDSYNAKNLILYILLAGKPISNIENQFFSNICSQLPNRHNLTSIINSMILPFKEKIKDILIKMPIVFICVDEWTDIIRRNFLGVTAHGLINGSIESLIISFQKIKAEKVTGDYLQNKLGFLIQDLNIIENFDGIISDNATNMVSAFNNDIYKRKCCIAHTLNLIIQDIYKLFNEQLKILKPLHTKTKKSTVYLNICKNANNSISKISSYCPTRWYSLYEAVHSFNVSILCLLQFLNVKKIQIPFNEEHINFFKELEGLLIFFKKSIEYFENDNFGQISKAFTELFTLKDSCLNYIQNSSYLRQNYESVEKSINQRYEMIFNSWGNVIFAASLLHPNRFYLSQLNEEQKRKGCELIKSLLYNTNDNQVNSFIGETPSQIDYLRRNKNDKTDFSDELQKFLMLSPPNDIDVLQFWLSHQEIFPNLTQVAIKILSIPTSSASIERVFSKAKELLNNKQLRTSENILEGRMMFMGNPLLFQQFIEENWCGFFET